MENKFQNISVVLYISCTVELEQHLIHFLPDFTHRVKAHLAGYQESMIWYDMCKYREANGGIKDGELFRF